MNMVTEGVKKIADHLRRGEGARRATFDDLEAIMDINDNVYSGLDYMPTLFYTFMHSKQHNIYVHEKDGKLIGLSMLWVEPGNDDLIVRMASRTRPSFQGQGIMHMETSPLMQQFNKDHPKWRRVIADSMLTPTLRNKMKAWKILYIWNTIRYNMYDRQQLVRFATRGENIRGDIKPVSLSYSDAITWLACSDELIHFVSKFSTEYIPVGPTWIPLQINKVGLRQVFSTTKALISYANIPTEVAKSLSVMAGSTDEVGLSVSEGGMQKKGREKHIIGFSYSTSLPCRNGLRVDIFFFGNEEDVPLSHVHSHVRHYVSMTQNNVNFGTQLHFPKTINSKNIEERLKEDLGKRYSEDPYSVTEAVLYLDQRPLLLSKM